MPQAAPVRVPSTAEFQDIAIAISRLLRDAKVDAPLRPRVLAAILLAAAEGEVHADPARALDSVNRLAASAVASVRTLGDDDKRKLTSLLRLAGADFEGLAPFLPAIVHTLERLNVRSAFAADIDFFGLFYEAFLRYGFDNNALGIVFTPRHITRFCVDLLGVAPGDRVIDIACGTGGFLVAAHDAMCRAAGQCSTGQDGVIAGTDTNPTVWALATLNLLFRSRHDRGGPATRIEHASCFQGKRRRAVAGEFTRAFLNPPFSQDAEPERDFIDAAMDALVPGGRCAVVVKAGIFADGEHAAWRAAFVRRHSVLGVVSLPEDVFYPASAPTSVLLAEAGAPQREDAPVLMARVWNDGFEKLKNKRVERSGCELPEVLRCFQAMDVGKGFASSLAVTVAGAKLKNGNEWSPQEWLPQPQLGRAEVSRLEHEAVASIFRSVTEYPELAAVVLEDFTECWDKLPPLPAAHSDVITRFFHVANGRSAGEKHYRDGSLPYISSGDGSNSVVRLVDGNNGEVFAGGGITVTAFGQAAVQPWPFLARGNGGSSVRVLTPKFRMGLADLAWFAAQINAQKWRFFYARMAIKSRIERLVVTAPARRRPQTRTIAQKVREFRTLLSDLSRLS